MRCKTASIVCWKAMPFVALFCLLSVVGCGGGGNTSTGEVSGKVTVAGKPLADGGVAFLASDGRTASAPVKDGTYSCKTVPTGKVKVGVVGGPEGDPLAGNPHVKGMQGMMQKAKQMGGKADVPATPAAKKQSGPKVATKYGNPDSSGFEFELKQGEKKDYNIEIP
jgi:hypothetical protein